MKMYFEFIFFLNFMLDFMILYGTKRLLKINKATYRILFGSLFGAVTTYIIFIDINTFTLFFLKIIFSIFMILISFGPLNFFQNIFYFYVISLLIGGFIYCFDWNNNYYIHIIFLIVSSVFLIIIFVKEYLTFKYYYKDKYYVTFYYKNKKYQLEGMIDTGNQLFSPIKRKSIILINLKIPIDNVIYVPYKALNTTGVIPCFRADKIVIDDRIITNCLIGIATDKIKLYGVNCILPNMLKEILC